MTKAQSAALIPLEEVSRSSPPSGDYRKRKSNYTGVFAGRCDSYRFADFSADFGFDGAFIGVLDTTTSVDSPPFFDPVGGS